MRKKHHLSIATTQDAQHGRPATHADVQGIPEKDSEGISLEEALCKCVTKVKFHGLTEFHVPLKIHGPTEYHGLLKEKLCATYFAAIQNTFYLSDFMVKKKKKHI